MSHLPTSRLAHRQPRRGRWSLAIAAALAVNAALIGVLARSTPAIQADPLPPLRPLLAAPPPPAPSAPAVVRTAPGVRQATPSRPRLPALPSPALPAAALAPPAIDGWLAGITAGTATGATAPASGPTGPGTQAWDTPPHPYGAFDLERFYPLRQRRRGEGSTVVVIIDVAADGALTAVSVATNSGHADFCEATLRAVRSLRWFPAEAGGVAVPSRVRQTIVWRVP